jgi:AraC-like DNA-binding protein
MAQELGWSHKHLVARFQAEVGLPPKRLARILRFERALSGLQRQRSMSLADVALEAGYCDQAHLNRDFRRLAGLTPTEYLARRLPGGGGVAD